MSTSRVETALAALQAERALLEEKLAGVEAALAAEKTQRARPAKKSKGRAAARK